MNIAILVIGIVVVLGVLAAILINSRVLARVEEDTSPKKSARRQTDPAQSNFRNKRNPKNQTVTRSTDLDPIDTEYI